MNEEEAKEILKTMKENIDKKYFKTRNSEAIETVLNLLEKKDKLIKVMAKDYVCKRKCNLEDKKNKYTNCIECVIDFYERKVENGN